MINEMSAPVAWITGGTRGLGRALVKLLYRQGYHVYFTGRDKAALDSLTDELQDIKRSLDTTAVIRGIVLDHSDLAEMAKIITFLVDVPAIDLLVNNAGLIPKKPSVTAQGFEQAFGINYLAHVLLTRTLWPKLLAANQARVINVSSLAFGNGVIDWQQPRALAVDGWQAYSASKLALVLFTEALAARTTSKITVNSVCPGIVDSDLLKDHPLFPPAMLARLANAMQSADVAADYLLWLATAPELQSVSGQFFSRSQGAYQPLRLALDKTLTDKLWQHSMQWLGLPLAQTTVHGLNPWE